MAKTHEIDGVTYVEIGREAKVGDKILIIDENISGGMYSDGDILTVTKSNGDTGVFCEGVSSQENFGGQVDAEEYVVLDEAVTVDSTQASEQVIEMFAALSRKIVSLERKNGSLESQLADTQRNVERQAEELENAKHRISKHATMFGIVEERVDSLTDDVITISSLVSPKESEEETITLPKWWVEILMKHAGGVRP